MSIHMRTAAITQGGYVALIAILIVGAVSTTIALALLMNGVDSQRAVLVTQRSVQARNGAVACAEEALQEMHDNTTYVGTDTLTVGQASCTYTVTNTGGAARTIDVTATAGSVVRKIKIYATIGGTNISITSWQEVNDV